MSSFTQLGYNWDLNMGLSKPNTQEFPIDHPVFLHFLKIDVSVYLRYYFTVSVSALPSLLYFSFSFFICYNVYMHIFLETGVCMSLCRCVERLEFQYQYLPQFPFCVFEIAFH